MAGAFAYGARPLAECRRAHANFHAYDPPMDPCTCCSVIGRGQVQWPCDRERLARRAAGGALRVAGRTGSGKYVPSGNSRYRLNTCTCPSPPRLPSITNLVPTGNRLGRRPEPYAMITSWDAATVPLQCVGQLICCMPLSVIHVIPKAEPCHAWDRLTSPPDPRRDRKAPQDKGFFGFSGKL